jgi:hypothetical protein
MIKVYQQRINIKDGDCLKCCVASMFEKPYEEVPNFIEYNNGDWLLAMRYYLEHLNLYPIMLKREEPFHQEVDYIAIGKSPRARDELGLTYSHAVIMNGNKMIHDPHPSQFGILQIRCAVLFQPIDLSKMKHIYAGD